MFWQNVFSTLSKVVIKFRDLDFWQHEKNHLARNYNILGLE